jgi:hypothetical protein
VRDTLPQFNAERGGVTLIPAPTLADVTPGISLITAIPGEIRLPPATTQHR